MKYKTIFINDIFQDKSEIYLTEEQFNNDAVTAIKNSGMTENGYIVNKIELIK